MMKHTILVLILMIIATTTFAHVQLNNPSGGETFFAGDTITIQWQELATHATENYDLSFSSDGGVNWVVIELDINPNHREYDWVVPDEMTDKGSVMVVQDNEGTDYSDDCDYFTIMGTSGIFDRPGIPSFSVYPNPAANFISVQFDPDAHLNNDWIRIINQMGQSVHEVRHDKQPGEIASITINTSEFTEGLYFIVNGNNSATETRKVIISR